MTEWNGLKRQPIKRKTPLARGTSELSRKPAVKGSNSTLRPRSARMKAIYSGPDGRREFVREQLALRPICEAKIADVCTGYAQDLHEPNQRSSQGSILDVENSMSVCRLCHGEIHLHPKESGQKGWLINKHTPQNNI